MGSCHRQIKLLRQTRCFREKVLFCFQINFEEPNKFSFFSLFLNNKKPLSLRKFCYKYTTQVSLWSVPKRLQLANYPPSRKSLSYCQGIPLWAYCNTEKEKKMVSHFCTNKIVNYILRNLIKSIFETWPAAQRLAPLHPFFQW